MSTSVAELLLRVLRATALRSAIRPERFGPLATYPVRCIKCDGPTSPRRSNPWLGGSRAQSGLLPGVHASPRLPAAVSRGLKLLLIYAVLLAPLVTATLPAEQRWRMRLVTLALTLVLWLGWP